MITIKSEVIVLRAVKYSENDLILTVFARSFGKMSVMVRGARKIRSKNLAVSQLFSTNEYTMRPRGTMYTLLNSFNRKSRFNITYDLEAFSLAAFIVHCVERNIEEGHPNLRLFEVLDDTLDILEKEKSDNRFIAAAFLLKMLDYTGFRPVVTQCVNCSSHDLKTVFFNVAEGGMVCNSCKDNCMGNIKIDPTIVELMDFILKNRMDVIETAKVSSILSRQLFNILIKYIEYHMENISFKSLEVLRKL